ncbi:MAG: hypothetical protein WAQ98_25555 [Blastocatellia bacterium]
MDDIKKSLQLLNWKKMLLVVGGSLLLDLAASLAAEASLKVLLIHAGIVFGTTTGAFLLDAAKKIQD